MRHILSVTSQVAALAWGALGSGDEVALLQAEARVRRVVPGATGERFRQVMRNYGDVQYVSNLTVGGQVLGGILDTGSFELVVFARTCSSCGLAGLYDHRGSGHYSEGMLVATHTYGSGNLYSLQAFDRVEIGPLASDTQAFWEVTSASMPLLDSANFAAIVGIGPPPARAPAEAAPAGLAPVVARRRGGLGQPALQSRGFLGGMSVSLFSVCLGARPGSDGYFVWNDADPRRRPDVFAEVPVVGTRSWGVMLTAARLTHSLFSIDLGCAAGCGAIIDSGTSLLVVPPAVIDQVSRAVESLNADCSNLHVLPTLVFSLGGRDYSLPPDAYVGDESALPWGAQPEEDEHFRAPHRCRLLLMETDTQTQFGPMWVLGMPFFRRYYTTFDLGRGAANRSVFTARAGPLCTPASELRPAAASLLSTGPRPRVDTSQAVVSPWVQAAAAAEFVRI